MIITFTIDTVIKIAVKIVTVTIVNIFLNNYHINDLRTVSFHNHIFTSV